MAKKRAYAEWGRQPIGPVGIEYDHARAEGLVFFAPLSGAHGTRDLVQEQLGVRTGLEAYLPSQAGALHHLFGSSSYVDFPVLPAVGHTTPTTIAWTQEPRSTSTYSAVLWIKPTGATYGFAIYESAADSAYYFVVGRRNPTGGGVDVSTFSANVGAVTNDRLDRFVLTLPSGMTSGGGARLWRNGVEVAAGTSLPSNEFSTNTTAAFRVGALESGGDPFEGLIGDMRIWSRVLPGGDAEDESTVPGGWKLYAKSRILVPVSAGGDVTTSLSGEGSTASAGTLANSRTVAASGQAATASAGTVAPSLTIALSGQAVTASAGTVTQSKAAALSGQAATASAGTLGETRTVALSGQAATASAGTVTYTADGNVTLALSGQAVAASAGAVAPSMSRAVSGQAATVSAGTAVAGLSIAASGAEITTAAGTLTLGIVVPLSGQAAAAGAGTVTYSTAGAVVVALTGQAVEASAGTMSYAEAILSAAPIGRRLAGITRSDRVSTAVRAARNSGSTR